MFKARPLTRARARFALATALIVDALQFASGPPGWLGLVQFLDVLGMILTIFALGFHVLLLPTFLLEFIPGIAAVPTWTGCVIAVIALRKREPTPPPIATPPRIQEPPPPNLIQQ